MVDIKKKKKKDEDTELNASFEEMAEAELNDDDDDDDGYDDEARTVKSKSKSISKEWYDRLMNELETLKNVKLPAVIDRIKEARSYWDLSENAEYEAALADKDLLEQRITEIRNLLEWVVIEDEKSSTKWDKIVKYWSVVTVEFIDNSDRDNETFEIVSTWELVYEHPIKKISFESPLWTAIEWKWKGETCRVRAEKWRYQVKIIEIK